MTTALVFAGGTGIRMNTRANPKQFLLLHGKPVIIYTLEHFEYHSEIDNIVIVCLESWIDQLGRMLHQFGIAKVVKIVKGGLYGHDSIYNGLEAMSDLCKPNDIVLIHDGVRPLITADLISANIAKVKAAGNAITVENAVESVSISADEGMIGSVPYRKEVYSIKAPQSFRYRDIYEIYQKARTDKIGSVDSAHLMSIYGVKMHTVKSTPNNIKITTPTDFYIFRALYEAMENMQILGV